MSVDVRTRITAVNGELKFEVHTDHMDAQPVEKTVAEELKGLTCRMLDLYLETLKEPKEELEAECEILPSTSNPTTTTS